MTSLTISLPDDIKAFVEDQAARGGFVSIDDYLASLLRETRLRQSKQELEEKLLEGLKGPFTEMTPEEWESIEREGLERLAAERSRS
jgi:antitoxin ParD1/3/4